MPLLLLAALLLLVLALREGPRLMRRERFKSKSGQRVTERLTDPREAAAILLVQQAAYEGHVTTQQKAVIKQLMAGVFGSDEADAEGLFSFGRMAVGQVGDAANSIRRILRPVIDNCTLAEMKDLVAMLEQVAETDGPANAQQRALVARTRRALSLTETA